MGMVLHLLNNSGEQKEKGQSDFTLRHYEKKRLLGRSRE